MCSRDQMRKRTYAELAEEIEGELARSKLLQRQLQAEQAALAKRANAVALSISMARKRLKKLPYEFYSASERDVPELPLELVRVILNFHVRLLRKERTAYVLDPEVPLPLYSCFDPVLVAAARVRGFSDYMADHRLFKLVSAAARWNSPWAGVRRVSSEPPRWKSEPITGASLAEALDYVPTLTMKADRVTATLFGRDGLLVFKCHNALEVMRLSCRCHRADNTSCEYSFNLAFYVQHVKLLDDGSGFCAPYSAFDFCACSDSPENCLCKPTFFINKISMGLQVALL